MDIREYAKQLLEEYDMCCKAKPKHNAVDIQLDKDVIAPWAVYLNNQLSWGTDNEIAKATYQLESRLTPLKEKLIFEVLKHGPI